MTAAADPALEPFLAAYRAAKPELPGGVEAAREAAIARFSRLGLPTRKVEGWRYTDLRRLRRLDRRALAGAGGAPEPGAALPEAVRALDACRIALVDGRFAPALSSPGLPGGVAALSARLGAANGGAPAFDGARADHTGLAALNAAMTRDGLVVEADGRAPLEKPVAIVHMRSAAGGGLAVHPRVLLRIGAGSAVELIEFFVGAAGADGWTNSVLEARLEPGARLGHVALVDQPGEAVHTGLASVDVGRDAGYSALVLSCGGRVARTETNVRLADPGARCALAGGALVDGRRHVDHTTEISHAAPHTASTQLFRNVVDDRGRSVFQGRVVVEPGAQKADARQSCRNLLLSAAAEADNKPELRIFADDVKCSHGASVGDLDPEALFYLRARGVPEAEARGVLTRAFVSELFGEVPVAAARPVVEDAVRFWLGRRR